MTPPATPSATPAAAPAAAPQTPQMNSGAHFKRLVDAGNPVGEVVGIDKFVIYVRGLQPISINALVMFEAGTKGYVRRVLEDRVAVLHLDVPVIAVGSTAVLQHNDLVSQVRA